MQSECSSVVTCKELSSQHVTTSITRHVQDRSVQADSIDVGRPVSMVDAAVEVGESLLALSSQRHNYEVAQSSCVPSVAAALLHSNAICTASSVTGAAAVQQSCLNEQLPDRAFDFQNGPCHHQTVTVEQLPSHDTDSNHISESLPVVSESTSPGYQLSCGEHNSYETNAETSGPLDNLAQPEAAVCAESVVRSTVSC